MADSFPRLRSQAQAQGRNEGSFYIKVKISELFVGISNVHFLHNASRFFFIFYIKCGNTKLNERRHGARVLHKIK
jgi:hypothetical protein